MARLRRIVSGLDRLFRRGQIERELEVRTSADPASVAATLNRELAAVDHHLAIVGMTEFRERVEAANSSTGVMRRHRRRERTRC